MASSETNGSPLAGATVIATSAQLSRTTTANADGTYRLALLNPGDWTIKATKGGMSAPSEKTTVLVNNASILNLKLASEASAVVTVVAAARPWTSPPPRWARPSDGYAESGPHTT